VRKRAEETPPLGGGFSGRLNEGLSFNYNWGGGEMTAERERRTRRRSAVSKKTWLCFYGGRGNEAVTRGQVAAARQKPEAIRGGKASPGREKACCF